MTAGRGQFLIDDIVEKDADDAGRNARDEHLSPKGKRFRGAQRDFLREKGLSLWKKSTSTAMIEPSCTSTLNTSKKGFVAFRIRGYGKGQKFI